MTSDQLRSLSKKELASRARDLGIAGWHGMRKDELVESLAKSRRKPDPGRAAAKPKAQNAAARDTSAAGEERVESAKFDIGVPAREARSHTPKELPAGYGKDRIVAMVRDPYWLHAYWELTHQAVQRAEAALGQDWYGAKPILRLLDVSSQDTTSTSEAVVRDIEIHGGCSNWYIEVDNPPRSYRVDIGYLSRRGQFFPLARSNVVTTPRAGVSESIDENFADLDDHQAERIYAMSSGFGSHASSLEIKQFFEEQLHRPLSSPSLVSSHGSAAFGGPGRDRSRQFWFQLDAELIVYGATEPDARVTLQGEPVKLRPDGTFTMRFSLPDSRQIIPAVAGSADGVEERTIVLAVERNTKHLEPMIHSEMDE